ncbi:MAG: hypothetical protein HYV45_00140 [Candidatus Moranbacteria bacterium]|nr:hypothetical protein [Candidatus Moranbacteria bacterium]
MTLICPDPAGGGISRNHYRKKKKKLVVSYDDIISLENLLAAWKEFLKGKRNKKDVQEFEAHLMDNLFVLYEDLKNKTYEHGGYQAFKINDPKPRDIHKASVRDRLVHRAIYRILYPFFDTLFIADSYSCREGKGTHKALDRFRVFSRKVSCNHTKTTWVLKCDIRKFFASIDQDILLRILREWIQDEDILWLLGKVVRSFSSSTARNVGLPLGNLTSQLLVNISMNEFDQFVKHRLRARYYIRYADDFVILSRDKVWLECILAEIGRFLDERLHLKLHPDKVFIQTVVSGVDFLGWMHFSDHCVLRTVTKKRMFRKLCEKNIFSYLGLLSHGNGYRLRRKLTSLFFSDGKKLSEGREDIFFDE